MPIYSVTLKLKNGKKSALEVIALNKTDAEYRAAMRMENFYKTEVTGVYKTVEVK
jgi:hypothetical protein